MKKNVLMIMGVGVLLASCSSGKLFHSQKYGSWQKIKIDHAPEAEVAQSTDQNSVVIDEENKAAEVVISTSEETVAVIEEPVAIKSNVSETAVIEHKDVQSANVEVIDVAENVSEDEAQEAIFEDVEEEKTYGSFFENFIGQGNDISSMTESQKSSKSEGRFILAIILAILIPFVGVWVWDGLSVKVLIAFLLTLLFYFPGMIYALWVILE